MKGPIKDLFSLGKWTLAVWTDRHRHSLRPRANRYWSGKLVHYVWWRFELIRDDRGGALGILSDITGKSREELAARLREGGETKA